MTGNVLRNEFLEMAVDPISGGIKAIRAAGHRENRLGQQIAMRTATAQAGSGAVEKGHESQYTVMAADKISVISPGPLAGKVASRGRLMDREGQIVARFVETVTLRRGSRLIEVEIELEVQRQPGSDPWESYYAARFAWGDDTAELVRSVGFTGEATEGTFLEAPQFLDLRASNAHTTLFTAGLPYHRRLGPHKLDTLLVVRGGDVAEIPPGDRIGSAPSGPHRDGISHAGPDPLPVAAAIVALRVAVPSGCEERGCDALGDDGRSHPPSRSRLPGGIGTRSLARACCRVPPGRRDLLSRRDLPGSACGCWRRRDAVAASACGRFALAAARLLDPSGSEPVALEVVGDRVAAEVPAFGWIEIEAEYVS